jgi:ABC-type Fe3+ transport system permease subunit
MNDAELFLKYNYTETKDLCLHFLTLITAVLVFSLNFSEKVFDFQNSSKKSRLIVIIGWCLFLLSIILCGLGLVFNSIAGGDAVYAQKDYMIWAQYSYLSILLSGTFFVLGLCLTMVSAVNSRKNHYRNLG